VERRSGLGPSDIFFSTLPTVAEGFLLKTWRGGPDRGKPGDEDLQISNVNRRLSNLLAWLAAARPDVVCLQELKATDAAFPAAALREAGYGAIWQGQQSWNGVAILARDTEPVLTRPTASG
jgi:hypothetical protein